MDRAVGKGCLIPVSLPPGKKAGTFLGPEALSAPQQLGPGVSSLAEPSYAQLPHHGAWCQGRTAPMPTPAAPLQPEVRDGVGQRETTRWTAFLSKSWLLRSDKTPSDREFYLAHSRYCFTASPPSGAGHRKQELRPAGPRMAPGLGEGKQPL